MSDQPGIAEDRLAQVKAGAKQGEIQAQRQVIASLEAELDTRLEAQDALIVRLEADARFHQTEQARYRSLFADGAVSASILDGKQLQLATATSRLTEALAERERLGKTLNARIEEARSTLQQIAEVRPVDLAVAQSEVDKARARVDSIKTDLELCSVRAPRAGRVLKVHVRPGESVGARGIADIGQTDRMVAVAEVYQSDISKVAVGQRETVVGDGFEGRLEGRVSELGWQVQRQNVFSQEPAAGADNRIIEVKVLLDEADSRRSAGLTNMQVVVTISGARN